MNLYRLIRPVCVLTGVLLYLPGSGEAQALIQQLVKEICNCLTAEELVYPRIQADRCLTTVLDHYPREIRTELQLSIRKDEDRRALEAMLVDPLAADCQALQNLTPAPQERELRFSDIPLLRNPPARSNKRPGPDVPAGVVIAEPEGATIRGTLLRIENDQLEVRTPDGTLHQLQVDDRRLRRGLELAVGETYTFAYVLDWRSNEQSVVRKLQNVN